MTDTHVWIHETKPPHRSYPVARENLDALATIIDFKVDEAHQVRDAAGRLLPTKFTSEAPAAPEAKKEATK